MSQFDSVLTNVFTLRSYIISATDSLCIWGKITINMNFDVQELTR